MERGEKQKILAEMGGIPEDMYDRLVRELIAETREQTAKIRKAFYEDDYDTIFKTAHYIKGASGNLRVYGVYDMARKIEGLCAEEQAQDEIMGNLEKLEEILLRFEQEFK